MANKRIYVVFALIVGLASCSRVPKNVISEKDMRVILRDMQIAEALVETDQAAYRTRNERQKIYDAVFEKHGITQAQYDSSLIWYGKNMELYMQLYKLVLKDIEAEIKGLGDIQPHPLSGDVSDKDSIDIWIYDRGYTFASNIPVAMLKFDIHPEKPYSQESSYVFSVDVWGIPEKLQRKPFIRLFAEQSDTTIFAETKIQADGYYETVLKTVDQPVRRIYGAVFSINDLGKEIPYHHIYLNNIRMMKYNGKSDEPKVLKENS